MKFPSIIVLIVLFNPLASISIKNSPDGKIPVKLSAFKRVDANGKLKSNVLKLINMPDLSSDLFHKHNIVSWWPKRKLSWYLSNHPPTLTYQQTVMALNQAFSLWSNVTALSFIRVCNKEFNESNRFSCSTTAKPDIFIEFTSPSSHDLYCEHKFSESTLAHAFYPDKGVAHFNNNKKWTIDDREFKKLFALNPHFIRKSSDFQYNLIVIAAHEIGHLLGLTHSTSKNSVMHPDYKETMDRFQFNQDDIEAIQYLYGKPSERNEMFKLSRKNRQKYLNTVRFE